MHNTNKFMSLNQLNVRKRSPHITFYISCLFLLFALFSTNTIAQINTFIPANSPGGKGGEQGTNTNDSNGDDNSQEYIESKKLLMEQDINEANEAMFKAMQVNYDSLYNAFLLTQTKVAADAKIVEKYFLIKRMPKIYQLDTAIYHKIATVNKLYVKLAFDMGNASDKDMNSLRLIEEMAAGDPKIKTTDIVNYMLPTLVLFDAVKYTSTDYEKFINQFFAKSPALIYLCNKNFVNMLEKKQYNKLLKLHLSSVNVIDYRTQKK
jgi:hypothetical protein